VASVWYVGYADQRIITAANWTALGKTNTGDTKWSKGNGWSVSQSVLSAGQIAFLDGLDEFVVTATDGPRPGSAVTPQTNNNLTLSDVTEMLAASKAATPTCTITRDSNGRASAVTEDGVVSTISRDAVGQVATVTTAGTTRTISRDSAGRITGVS
jgi:YD repeat-containing protein